MRILSDLREASKRNGSDIFTAVLIILTGLLGFGLGRISKIASSKPPLVLWQEEFGQAASSSAGSLPFLTKGEYVVASRGGGKYYLPWCGGVKRIKEENKILFSSAEEAEKSGYAPSKTCKGL